MKTHRQQIAASVRGVIRSQKASGRRRGSGGYGIAAGHGAAASNELVAGGGDALGLVAKKAPSDRTGGVLVGRFAFVLLTFLTLAAILVIAAIAASYGV